MQDYEQLGVFYLGKIYDLEAAKTTDHLLLYDAKDLTTHAVCVGMTGSGKTGLCLALLEEAAIDGIPALLIDPKGDLGNLMLTFPQLRPDDFRPWIDRDEAARQGKSPDEFAAFTADLWKKGLAEWGQDGARIGRLREAADVAIYTPGSQIGLPLSVLKSFAAPPQAVLEDSEGLRERISGAVSGLLALVGIDADPIKSREHILLSNILDRAWRDGRDLDLGDLIRQIQAPGFDKIGVVGLDSFFPEKDRFALSMSLNNLLASPGFSAWTEGEPLDIQKLLYTHEGKPRLAILSIAHLSDAERMFFVTILLNEVLAWVRGQSGTSSLRALLYMDEVFGYFPPSANPPSKAPMLTLLKQARAFGLGVVLATQNPVDLDYKGLSNTGTWFLGRLQTERDKARVLDGLEGASTAAGQAFDRQKIDKILSGLAGRVFLMKNVHDDSPTLFQTRWTLSYLRGPLSREQVRDLTASRRPVAASKSPAPAVGKPISAAVTGSRPVLPPGIPEFFLPARRALQQGENLVYKPALLGQASVHFVQAAQGIDLWQKLLVTADVEDGLGDAPWDEAETRVDEEPELLKEPQAAASFADLASELTKPKTYTQLATKLKTALYQAHRLTLWRCNDPKLVSQPGESQADFRQRVSQNLREERDVLVEKLRAKYAPKLAALEEKIRKAQQRAEKEKSQATQQSLSTVVAVGTSILGALFGRKLASATNVNKAARSIRAATKAAQEHADVGQALENVETLKQQLQELDNEFQQETAAVKESAQPQNVKLEATEVAPRKSDLAVNRVALVWCAWRVRTDATIERA